MTAPAMRALPLGSIRPRGWLHAQLRLQVEGMAGHLDEHWPSIRDSAWLGGDADGWERGPYWLDGVVPLAHLTQDAVLLAKISRWIDELLARQSPDGWMGPDHGDLDGDADVVGRDVWPRAVLLKVLLQQHDATGDERLVPAMLRLCRAVEAVVDQGELTSWARFRASELSLGLHALWDLTGEAWLVDLARRVDAQGYPWWDFSRAIPQEKITLTDIEAWREQSGLLLPEQALATHGVNVAMGLKSMPVAWLSTGMDALRQQLRDVLAELDRRHGLPNGLFSADEHLAGRHPSQGTETCAVVEALFSLETTLRIWGLDEDLAQRWERIAFNALPAAATANDDAHQYDQQPNQVICHVTEDRVYSDNGPDANIFGLEPHFGCCTANRHQGWPKFVASLWARDEDDALVALSYAPAAIEVPTADGGIIRIEVSGDYPFGDEVTIRVTSDRPARQRLRLRVPGWADDPALGLNGEAIPLTPGTTHDLDDAWSEQPTVIRLTLRAPVERHPNADGTVTLLSGPLVFVHPIAERWETIADYGWTADREVHPDEPWAVAVDAGRPLSGRVRAAAVDEAAAPFRKGQHRVHVVVPVRDVANWDIEHGAAGLPPQTPRTTGGARESLFIPYGAARLRLTALPLLEGDTRPA